MSECRKAEHMMADQGLFAGHDGLRGLLNKSEFWAKQEYGTRLYYGSGGGEYLHRSALHCAIKALDFSAKEIERLREALQDISDSAIEAEARTLEITEGLLAMADDELGWITTAELRGFVHVHTAGRGADEIERLQRGQERGASGTCPFTGNPCSCIASHRDKMCPQLAALKQE